MTATTGTERTAGMDQEVTRQELAAEFVHGAMVWAAKTGEQPRDWQGGNSFAEDHARHVAQSILATAEADIAALRALVFQQGENAAKAATEYAENMAALREENARLREALAAAKNDLLAVGNDYPGSSCQKWCTERALAAWNVLEPWKHCPSTHCERSQECRAPNECSAARAALTEPSERGEAGR